MVAAADGAWSAPPSDIVDFLWNLHLTLVAQPGPLAVHELKETYFKQMGHKCAIERFLVVGAGGLGATLKRIPHIVNVTTDANGAMHARPSMPADTTRPQLIEADESYRQKLRKKTALVKAAAAEGKAAPVPKATPDVMAKAPSAAPASQAPAATRPAEGPAAGQPEAKKPKADANSSVTLAKMLLQGVVRVLQNRRNDGKGPLPVTELEDEFKALWKVPFNLHQAGESDAVTFLRKYPHKVEVRLEGNVHVLALAKKADPSTAPAAAPVAAAAAASPPATVPSIVRPVGPLRPPANIEDFLWYVHTALTDCETPVVLEQFKEIYSQQMGHKLVVERFLMVGEGGLAVAFKRIPHIVTVSVKDGQPALKATMPANTTKELLLAEDQAYKKRLQEKKQAMDAKAAAAAKAKAAATVGLKVSPPDAKAKAAPAAAVSKSQVEVAPKHNDAAAVVAERAPEEAAPAQETPHDLASSTATAASPSLQVIIKQVEEGFQEMKELVQRQEALVLALQKFSSA